MDSFKKKKNLAHIRNFNKQCFANWEFLNQTNDDKTSKIGISSQLFLSFLLITFLYLFASLGFSVISSIFFYDLWEDVTFLFTNQTFRENNAGVSALHALPNDAHAKFNNTLSKIEIFYSIGAL